MAKEPTSKFRIPCSQVLLSMEGDPMMEPTFDGEGRVTGQRQVTLGLVLAASANVEQVPDGVTLTILDRYDLLRRFRGAKDPELKIETVIQVKKLVAERFKGSPLIAGQALELLGDAPSDL